MPDTPYLRENHHVPSVPPTAAYVMPKSPMEPPRVATRDYQTQQQHKSVWSDSTTGTTDSRSGASSDYRSTIAGSSEGGHTEILWLYEGERESTNVGGGGRKDGNGNGKGSGSGTRLSAASSGVGSDYPPQPVSPLTPTEGRFFGGRDEETGPPPRRES